MEIKKDIKICHLTSAHPPYDIRIFHKECVSLAEYGYNVSLICAGAENEIKNGVHILGVKKNNSRFGRMFITVWRVYKKALELDAELYHFHDPELMLVGLLLKQKGKKVIYDVHEDLPRQILGKHWINKYLRKAISYLIENIENIVSRRLDYIIVATPFIRKRFLELNNKCVDICNYPITKDEGFGSTNWEDKKNELCYIGLITKNRGIVNILRAIEDTPYKLNLAGKYSPESLRNELAEMRGWTNVNEFNYVGREKIMEILSNSKVGIVTLHPQINYLDSLPIKMYEYMLAGIPVIASDFPLWKGIIEGNNCGICVNPNDPTAIRGAIDKIFKEEEMAILMGKRGREIVLTKYNWENQKINLISIYQNILKREY